MIPARATRNRGYQMGLHGEPRAGQIDHTAKSGIGYRWHETEGAWIMLQEDRDRLGDQVMGAKRHETAVRNDGFPEMVNDGRLHTHDGIVYEFQGGPDLWHPIEEATKAAPPVRPVKPEPRTIPPTGVELEEERIRDLMLWWTVTANGDAEKTVPKAVEYGSNELIEAGRVLARLMHHEGVTDADAMEHQIYQYVLGKMGRWTAAMARGERVSDDTIFDIGIYVMMVRRIRETGIWP